MIFLSHKIFAVFLKNLKDWQLRRILLRCLKLNNLRNIYQSHVRQCKEFFAILNLLGLVRLDICYISSSRLHKKISIYCPSLPGLMIFVVSLLQPSWKKRLCITCPTAEKLLKPRIIGNKTRERLYQKPNTVVYGVWYPISRKKRSTSVALTPWGLFFWREITGSTNITLAE